MHIFRDCSIPVGVVESLAEKVFYDRDPVTTQPFRTELTMRIRHLQPIPLDTAYPKIV